ncbi:zinc dependent phospholipase C family protein [Candidatus Woesearchaeota archaeon]|jgi:hypothetical protein|nr:zinc dependent phospholipase C family protein [Candidatus Woesearchaeota archaeon]MBT4835043.1 zinc dependent phospholipase C family protein [Candidatus Woesearchaeota archaeon]MBT7474977.1 zinc dependent phospholipase C family protein [Candidatus Woesearchaeota archaeon]
MKKILFLLILLIVLQSTTAWDWNNHKSIVQTLYYSAPYEVQRNLDLQQLEIGSIAPDKDFHDNRLHHYPKSYNLTLYWLEETKRHLENKEYKNASYTFGVASHYISDSFVAPHYISGENPSLHSKFEKQGAIKLNCIEKEYNLKEDMIEGSKNSKDWKNWLETKNEKIPQKEIKQSMDLISPLFLEIFNTTCKTRITKIEEKNINIGNKTKNYLFLLLIFMIGNINLKRFKKKFS